MKHETKLLHKQGIKYPICSKQNVENDYTIRAKPA